MNATQLVMNAVDQNSEFADYPDQYGFNVVFANNSFELDPRWNNFAENINTDPFIIHFSGLKPLFKGYNFNMDYKDLFYELLKETPWTEYSPRSSFRSQTKKMLNLVSKNSWDIIGKKAWIAFSQKVRLRTS